MAANNSDGREDPSEKDLNGNTSCDGGIVSCPLSHPDDKLYICELLCFVRHHIEAFVVSPDIGDPRFRQMDGKIGVGRVGLRCIHCCKRNASGGGNGKHHGAGGGPPLPPAPASRNGAVSYPKATRLVYQSVRNWQRIHLMSCPAIPKEVKERYTALKTPAGRAAPKSGVSTGSYWEECCKRMGMVDTDNGIQLRTGRFIVEDENNIKRTKGAVNASLPLVASKQVSVAADEKHVQHATVSISVDSLKRSAPEVEERIVPSTDVSPQDKERIGVLSSPMTPPSNQASNQTTGTHGIQSKKVVVDHFRAVSSSSPIPRKQPSPTTFTMSQSSKRPAMTQEQNSTPLLLLGQQESTFSTNEKSCGSRLTALGVSHGSNLPANPMGTGLPVPMHGKFPPPTPVLRNVTPASFPLPNDVLLERLAVAQMIIQTIREACPPTEDYQYGDLSYLGAELYKLFSGERPRDSETGRHVYHGSSKKAFGTESTESSGSSEYRDAQQRTKRERKREAGSYTHLSELGLPSALCCVVSDLLGHGNDSYQSIQQVEDDLRLLAATPENYLFGNATRNFHLANISFCGREKEVSELLEAFDQATDTDLSTNCMVLITGYSGTGKSSLIQHVQSSFVAKGACFVSGKFDAMQQLQPLSAIASAMNDYCNLLSQDEDRIDNVREAIATAIGSEGNSLANLIPNLHKIVPLGDGPPIQVQGREALQRLLFTFRMLFWATCSKSHPVVMFLDDLQWADKVSLELMQVLVTDTMIEGLLLVGSYRDNEVGVDHPLLVHLGNIRRTGCVDITSIHLGNLDIKSVNSMVSDTLHLMPGIVRPLAEAVVSKTGGNALFVVQFLSSLQDEGLLRFSLMSKRWEWDINQIRDKNIADNAVELMVAKLLRLAPEVQEALCVAAGFGAKCQESLLRIFDRTSDNFISIVLSLEVAVSEGLMVKSDSSYRFSHDQIQHAAYLLIPEPDREKFHLRIGRLLWKSSSTEELEKYLFVVVDQLHRGSSLITDHEEKIKISELSLSAGQMAIAMSAFLPAAAYLKVGMGLLTDDDWIGRRNLCFDLFNSYAETAYTLGDFDPIRGHLEEVLSRTVTLQEKLRPYATLVKSLLAQGLSLDAVHSCTEILANLGESFPEVVTPLAVQRELVATQKLLCTKSEDELRNLEMMQYIDKQQAMEFLEILAECVFQTKKEYFPLVVCRMVNLSLIHGVCKESALCFAWYGLILCGHISDFDGAYRFGTLSLHTMEKFQANVYFAKIYVTVFGFINNWVQPIQLSLPCLKRAVDIGLHTGDTYSAFVASCQYVGAALCTGKPLGQLLNESELLSKRVGGYEQHALYPTSLSLRQTILNLQGRSDDPSDLMGIGDSEEGIVSAQYSFYSMWLEYLFGHYDRAAQNAKKIKGVAKIFSVSLPILVCNYTFFSGLTALAVARRDGCGKYSDVIDKAIAQMKIWAASSEWNCRHKLELMNAEYAYLQGDFALAAEAYEAAERTAANHSFIREQALALERAGIFYLETGEHSTAAELFVRACECYKKWGAYAKATHVREMYL